MSLEPRGAPRRSRRRRRPARPGPPRSFASRSLHVPRERQQLEDVATPRGDVAGVDQEPHARGPRRRARARRRSSCTDAPAHGSQSAWGAAVHHRTVRSHASAPAGGAGVEHQVGGRLRERDRAADGQRASRRPPARAARRCDRTRRPRPAPPAGRHRAPCRTRGRRRRSGRPWPERTTRDVPVWRRERRHQRGHRPALPLRSRRAPGPVGHRARGRGPGARRGPLRPSCSSPTPSRPRSSPGSSADAVDGIDVYGGVCCDHEIGGLNPAAVETALGLGGRIVWLPTLSSRQDVVNGVAEQLGIPGPGLVGDRRRRRAPPGRAGDRGALPRARRGARDRSHQRARSTSRSPGSSAPARGCSSPTRWRTWSDPS